MVLSPCKTLLSALGILVASVLPATGAIVTVDFDNVPSGPITPTALFGFGIDSITSGGGIPAAVYRCPPASCPDVLPNGSQSFLGTAGGSFPSPTGIFSTTLIFHSPTPFFLFFKDGFNVNTYGVAGWSATAYDVSDNQVATVGVNLAGGLDYPPSPTPVSYTLSGSADIAKVVFLSNYNFQSTSGDLHIDYLQFQQVTPEPATLLLAAAGIALVRLTSRLKSSARP